MLIQLDQSELPIYIRTIKKYHKNKEKTLDLIFSLLSPLLEQADFDRSLLEQEKIILQLKVCLCSNLLQQPAQRNIIKYKEELLSLYAMLKECLKEIQSGPISIPSMIDQLLTSKKGKCFVVEEEVVYLYIVCSVFMPLIINLMEEDAWDRQQLQLRNPESYCYSLDFFRMSTLYQCQRLFLEEFLEKPIRILKNFRFLQDFDFYQNIDLTLLFNEYCLVSSTIASPECITLIPLFNCAKIVRFGQLAERRSRSNNQFLNQIETLQVLKAFSFNYQYQKYLPSNSFCLTFSIPQSHSLRVRHFFQRIPPEMAPMTKYDILSYASGNQFKTIFYRIATEGYWQHCPQSEFLQVYFLCNQSYVEWASIPKQSYQGSSINSWEQLQMQAMKEGRLKMVRGVQKKGDFVIIGQGNEYFWRVKDSYGAAVLIKWSILLKTKTQIDKFLSIANQKEKFQIKAKHKFGMPLRRIIFSYIAHEYMDTEAQILKRLIKFVSISITRQKMQFQKLIERFSNHLIVNNSLLPSRLRLCTICGCEILNISILFRQNSMCTDCLQDFVPDICDKSLKFVGNYIVRPSLLDQFFKDIYCTRQKGLRRMQNPTIFESFFCQGYYTGTFQTKCCSGVKIFCQGLYAAHLWQCIPNLALQIFMKRGYYSTVESVMKSYPLRKRASHYEAIQMQLLLIFLSRNCLRKQEKAKIREQISLLQRKSNFVEWTMQLLAEEDTL